jgi:hypothetical protein
VALTVDVVGTTLFVLSQQDAVILAAQLLDAAKDNPGAAMPQ